MARPENLRPRDAKTEGQRRLRERLRRQTASAVARTMGLDASTVRKIATGERKPGSLTRTAFADHYVEFSDEEIWDLPPVVDTYAGDDPDPATTRRT